MKIISGGQTVADIAALRAAIKCNLITGGTAPKNYFTENGPDLELKTKYNLEECDSSDYKIRTLKNIIDSEITLIFAKDFNSSGTRLTIKYLKQLNKPFIKLDVENLPEINFVIDKIKKFNTINVAGNRKSKFYKIEEIVESYLIDIFNELKGA